MTRWPTRLVSIALIPAALAAQQSQPVFKAGVRLIEVDVQVTDEKGNTVHGLSRDDFTILEAEQPGAREAARERREAPAAAGRAAVVRKLTEVCRPAIAVEGSTAVQG